MKKVDKKTAGELYMDVLEFPQTGEISLFENKIDYFSVSLSINSLRMRPNICVLDMETVSDLIRGDIWDLSWPDSIRQCEIPDICSELGT